MQIGDLKVEISSHTLVSARRGCPAEPVGVNLKKNHSISHELYFFQDPSVLPGQCVRVHGTITWPCSWHLESER